MDLPAAPKFGDLRGHLNACTGTRVTGWAQDTTHPDAPVCLDVLIDDVFVAHAYAARYRADLERAGIGDGRHAFDLRLPNPLDPTRGHTITLRRSADGAVLMGVMQIGARETVAA